MKSKSRDIVYKSLDDLRAKIINNHRAAGQVASGKTIESLKIEDDSESSLTLFGRKAFGTLETGRKAGKVPKGFYYIILQWMQDKKIQVEKPKTFAYFVAKKIAEEGTSLFRSGGRSDVYSKEIPITISELSEALVKRIKQEILNIKLN